MPEKEHKKIIKTKKLTIMSQDLTFDLIQSLSPNEKRFFRLQSGEEKNYLHVFDALDTMKEYDAELLKKKLRKKKLNISYEKNYLYNQILKSLRIYHTEANVKSKARAALDFVDVLLQKGLFDQALKVVKKNEAVFEAYENFSNLIALHEYEEALLHRVGGLYDPDKVSGFYAKRSNVLEKLQNLIDYRILERQMINLNHSSQFSMQSDRFQEIKKHRLLLDDKSQSFDAKFRFLQMNAMIAIYEHDYKKEALYFREIVTLINAYPAIRDAYYKVYQVTAIHNYINACLSCFDFDEAAKAVAELKRLDALLDYREQDTRTFALIDESSFYIETGQVQKGLKMIPLLLQCLKKFPHMPGYNRSLLLYNMALIHFVSGEYRESAKNLQGLIDELKGSEYKDRQAFSRIMLMICYYEMNKFDMIDYVLNSTQRFFKRNDRYYKTEKALLDFFKNAVKMNNVTNTDLEKLKHTLDHIFMDKNEASLQFLFDFITWIDSKVRTVSFVQAITEKVAVAGRSIFE